MITVQYIKLHYMTKTIANIKVHMITVQATCTHDYSTVHYSTVQATSTHDYSTVQATSTHDYSTVHGTYCIIHDHLNKCSVPRKQC